MWYNNKSKNNKCDWIKSRFDMEENIVSIINFKSDNGMTAVIKSSYNSVKLYVKDKDGNIIIDNKPYSGVISAKNALRKLGGNWEMIEE